MYERFLYKFSAKFITVATQLEVLVILYQHPGSSFIVLKKFLKSACTHILCIKVKSIRKIYISIMDPNYILIDLA